MAVPRIARLLCSTTFFQGLDQLSGSGPFTAQSRQLCNRELDVDVLYIERTPDPLRSERAAPVLGHRRRGVRVLIDGQVALDQWADHPLTTYRFTRDLGPGRHRIEVRYFDPAGNAVIRVRWS
jgi:hypothetical protein